MANIERKNVTCPTWGDFYLGEMPVPASSSEFIALYNMQEQH